MIEVVGNVNVNITPNISTNVQIQPQLNDWFAYHLLWTNLLAF